MVQVVGNEGLGQRCVTDMLVGHKLVLSGQTVQAGNCSKGGVDASYVTNTQQHCARHHGNA
jgi:hypothetical protein